MKHPVIMISIVSMFLLSVVVGYDLYSLNGDSFDFSDTETRVVISGSMDGESRTGYDIETIPLKSLVFIQKVSEEGQWYDFHKTLDVGDVITFHYMHPVTDADLVITHRIVGVSDSKGDIVFTLMGDVMADDPTNSSVQVVYASSGDIIGKVVGVSPSLGPVVLFLSSVDGKVSIIGCFASILFLIWFGPMVYRKIAQRKMNKGLD